MTSGTNLISVVIPCYNGERFIGRAVESVLNQTVRELELIIIDDGSSDTSRSLIEGFAQDDRVSAIFHEGNRGIPSARNTGITGSTGRYVAFLDQDDYWRRDKLERQMEIFARDETGEIGLVFSDVATVDERGRTIRRRRGRIPRGFNAWPRTKMLRALFCRNFIPIVSSLVRRECFDTVGLLEETITSGGDDYEFCLRLLTSYRVCAIEDPLAVRTMHGANYTNAARMLPDVLQMIDAFAKRVPEVQDLLDRQKGKILADIGGYYQRVGDSRRAQGYFREALAHSPGNIKASLGYLGTRSGAVGKGIARLWYCMKDGISRSRE